VFHVAVAAVKSGVASVVERGGWDGLVPLKVELNLARRSALNLVSLEAVLAHRISRVLRQAQLGKSRRHGRGVWIQRGVNCDRISVHGGVIPVEQSVTLTLSDLMSNAAWRRLWEQSLPGEIKARELDAWLTSAEWRSITEGVPVTAPSLVAPPQPPTPIAWEARLGGVLRGGGPWRVEELLAAGLRPGAMTAEEREQLLRRILDESEDACQIARELDRAEALGRLALRLIAADGWARGLEETTLEGFRSAADSVRVAVANHRGHGLPGWLKIDRVRERSRLLAGDVTHLDAVALLHNRLAVNALNRFEFAEWRDSAEGLVEILRAERRGAETYFGGAPGPSWGFGALLGTIGQAHALAGFVARDDSLLDRAGECFGEAIDQFTLLADTTRQWTYAAHLQLEKVRLVGDAEFPSRWVEILDVVGEEFEADREGFCADPAGREAWRQAYAVQVLLKRSWLLDDEAPDWAASLADSMGRITDGGSLAHPCQQIAGQLVVLLGLAGDHPLVAALRRTAERDATLVGLIARTWMLDIDDRDGKSADLDRFEQALPGWLASGWKRAGMPEALANAAGGRAPFVEALPFYYF